MGASFVGELLESVGTAAAGAAVASTLAPKPPKAPTPPQMANQEEIDQNMQLQEAKAASARFGRAATILTDNNTGTDRLGP